LLGPRYTDEAIAAFLNEVGAKYTRIDDEQALCRTVAEHVAAGKVVGLAQGRMEFGPRALGCRSILGDARRPEMQSVMNLKVKFRESFRPFAPAVLRRRAEEYFDMHGAVDSPYMLFIAPVSEEKRLPLSEEQKALGGLQMLGAVRSEIPSATHVDYSARVQTVDAERHGRFYRVLEAFEKLTGCPVIINTSFNLRGEPIVCTPGQAYRCFMASAMDVLVMENHLLLKEEQPAASILDPKAYLDPFEFDRGADYR
jgi:carbamoyltransferase